MELTHNFTVPVAPEVAFEVLQDIERIGPCMPGATIDSVDGKDFTGTVKVKIGPIKVTYQGEAEYSEVDAEALTATINARGKESRGSGTANAVVRANITPSGDGADVNVVTDLAVTGKPAQFGRGVMEEVGQKLINQFAECLATKLADDGGEEDDAAQDSSEGSAEDSEDTPDSSAASLSSGGSSSAATAGSAATSTGGKPAAAPRQEPEAIDLLDVAGAPVAKRAAPVVGILAVVLLLWWLKRRGE
ncbi:SRPBCC family protein [Euzebya tangerina]|uniref:SRPBCC family protein n=1 Tax=Euzebya tangerina TaxID=591198 RepID=UPI000E321BE3|nr:SRPBCC family protein [Euzebya tangerina]